MHLFNSLLDFPLVDYVLDLCHSFMFLLVLNKPNIKDSIKDTLTDTVGGSKILAHKCMNINSSSTTC